MMLVDLIIRVNDNEVAETQIDIDANQSIKLLIDTDSTTKKDDKEKKDIRIYIVDDDNDNDDDDDDDIDNIIDDINDIINDDDDDYEYDYNHKGFDFSDLSDDELDMFLRMRYNMTLEHFRMTERTVTMDTGIKIQYVDFTKYPVYK